MKANEFVKKYGLDKAKREVSYKGTMMQCNNSDGILDQLQEILDAFELIEKHGGIHGFKTYCNGDFSDADLKAIKLVESCR